MIARSDVMAACHCMADSLQGKGDRNDYYKINHISGDDWERLTRIVCVWLALQKIDVDYDK